MSTLGGLAAIRRRVSQGLLLFLWLNVLVVALLSRRSGANGTVFLVAICIGLATSLCWLFDKPGNVTRWIISVAMISFVSIILFEMQGHPWQTDIHMYYFAALAVIALYCDWLPILLGAATIAFHHFVLTFLFPEAVYPGTGGLGRVALHTIIVIIESIALIWMSAHICRLFAASDVALLEAEAARRREAEAHKREIALQAQAESLRRHTSHDLAEIFEAEVHGLVREVASAASIVRATAKDLAQTADNTAHRTAVLTQATGETAQGVGYVAEAARDLSVSVREVTEVLANAAAVAEQAVIETSETSMTVKNLASTAEQIGEIINMIGGIARQTNLLALNASIEAARAGDAGRGFNVVASEVKSLAKQTTEATAQIQQRISAIQLETGKAVDAIARINGTIANFSTITNQVASAAGEQGEATRQIADNASKASAGTEEVSSSVEGLSQSTVTTGKAAADSLAASEHLSSQCQVLQHTVHDFLSKLRAA